MLRLAHARRLDDTGRMVRSWRQDAERHRSGRGGWLRAAVLGAEDGVVSTASLMLGVAAASAVCELFGEALEPRRRKADEWVARGLARWEGKRLALTDAGADLHSPLSAELM